MWDTTFISVLTIIFPSLVSLSTFKECLTSRVKDDGNNSKPEASRGGTILNPTHPDTRSKKVTITLIPFVGRLM